MANDVATTEKPRPIDVFRKQIRLAAPTLQKMIPAHIPYAKFEAQLVTAVAYNPRLLECTQSSLLRAAAECVSVGLSISPTMKEADILPVWGKDGTEAQFRPRYIGLMKLARQSGEIAKIYAHEIYSNDEFHFSYGLKKDLVHVPAEGDRGKLGHPKGWGYCVWETKDGAIDFEVINEARVNRAKSASEGYRSFKAGKIKSTPWETDPGEMVRKTAVQAASKFMPRSTESDGFLRALHADGDHEIDGVAEETAEPTQITAPPEPATKQLSALEEKIAAAEPKPTDPDALPK